MLYEALGPATMPGCADLPADSVCWHCGGEARRGMDRADWNGSEYVGQNRVRAWTSRWVCEPCLCVMAWPSPLQIPGKAPAKADSKRGLTWRNFSVLYEAGTVVAASKGEKPAVLAFLRRDKRGPWFAAIADSGQKHVVPYCAINATPRGGVVQFEERVVTLGNFAIIDEMAALLTAGATKETIASGEYDAGQWQRCGEAIDAFEARWSRERASGWFDLALWLAQRDEAAVAARMDAEKAAKKERKNAGRKAAQSAGDADGGVGAGPTGRVPRKPRLQRAQALGSDAGSDAGSSADDGQRGRVGDECAEGPAPERAEPRQRSLF